MPSADSSRITKQPYGYSCLLQDILEASWGKAYHFPCTTARSTLQLLSGYGLHGLRPTRPNCPASYLVSVRQLTSLLHASFRPYLTVTPLRFASPSPPLGWAEDLHLLVVYHAQHNEDRKGPHGKPSLPHHLAYGSRTRRFSKINVLCKQSLEYPG
jgi:hypothetical protein